MWKYSFLSYMLENNIFELKNHDFRSNSKWGHFFSLFRKRPAWRMKSREDTPPLPPSKGPTRTHRQGRDMGFLFCPTRTQRRGSSFKGKCHFDCMSAKENWCSIVLACPPLKSWEAQLGTPLMMMSACQLQILNTNSLQPFPLHPQQREEELQEEENLT